MRANASARAGQVLRRGLLYGLPWSVFITTSQSLSHLGSLDLLLGQPLVFATWIWEAVVLAMAATALEPLLDRRWKIALAVGVVAIGVAALEAWQWMLFPMLGVSIEGPESLNGPLPSSSNFLFTLWQMLFHGGLFIVACVLVMRSERSRHLLAEAQIERNRTQALLDDAQLDALRGQLDPAFLLRAMACVQARYARDAAGADRLLDQLVGFLRQAMPGVRSGVSSLRAELALAQSYAELCAAIEPDRTPWQVEVTGPLPDLPFPPWLLLPVMDQLVGEHRHRPAGRLLISVDADSVAIAFVAASAVEAAALPRALTYRLRVALWTTFGDACSFSPAPHGTPQGHNVLAWRIDLRAARDRRARLADPEPLPHPAAPALQDPAPQLSGALS